MAGSFDLFRRNQRIALAALAIMAMIAFFVLPPFLQMGGGGGGGGGDPVVVSWKGGEFRQSGMERAVAMRSVVNRFLAESLAAAGGDPSRMNFLPDDERSVVRSTLLAREAAANGIVVSDAAINDFLGQFTNNLVRQDQFDEIISRLRLGPMGVSQHDLFEALRTALAAQGMQVLFQSGFSGDPPGWRWDYFRRLEQAATVEVVPVVAESLAGEVAAPSEATLKAFFERYKEDLPAARSPEPGFKEPHRAKFEYLVAKREAFEAEAAKNVTDEQIAAFYEKNKTSLFRAKRAEESKPEASKSEAKADGTSEAKADGEATPADAGATPAADPAPEPPAADADKKPEAATPAPSGAAAGGSRFTPVAFKQPQSEPAASPPAAAEAKPSAEPPAETPPVATADADKAAKDKVATEPEAAADFEPLEKVKDDIRKRLAGEAAEQRIDAVFTAVAGDMSRYAQDVALWQARHKDRGVAAPTPPDVDKIAKLQGLEAGRSELLTAEGAIASGPIGGSFELVADRSSRFGIRQQRWLDMIFASGAPSLRPVTSRDPEGNRYISWKTEDQPEFVPTFDVARKDVEHAWRIVEARSLARAKAEAIARQADASKQTLEAAAAAAGGLKAATVGPFSWLTQGTVPFGTAPSLSQPEGLSMPGEEFMQAVFGLQPGQTTVAFNEPRTVCYAIRSVSLEPAVEKLRERFVEERNDQRRLAMVAQRETSKAVGAWAENLENRYDLEWKREPR